MVLNPVDNTVLILVDVQGGDLADGAEDRHQLSIMSGRPARMRNIEAVLTRCRAVGIPCIFIQEVHKPSLVDIGRELDGAEGAHCVEGESSVVKERRGGVGAEEDAD